MCMINVRFLLSFRSKMYYESANNLIILCFFCRKGRNKAEYTKWSKMKKFLGRNRVIWNYRDQTTPAAV